MELHNLNYEPERVVVDEIMDDGTARLLRAPRLLDASPDDFSINTWGDEREDFISAWRIEAFVGYKTRQHLSEGDVFFIGDSTRLNNKYKPIPRDEARELHLLCPWDESRKIARNEIKMQFHKLAASAMASKPQEEEILIKKIETKFK
jgi:hypothetical protein